MRTQRLAGTGSCQPDYASDQGSPDDKFSRTRNDKTAPTVAITAPSSGSTVTGIVAVAATASDDVGVVGVQFTLDGANLEDSTAPYSATWDTANAAIGTHTLRAVARDAANNTGTSPSISVTVSNSGGGDVFVAFIGGTVQWRNPDGTLRQTIPAYSTGQVSGMAFDAAGNMYVPHWWGQVGGNTVVRYDAAGNLLGTFGSSYRDDPFRRRWSRINVSSC